MRKYFVLWMMSVCAFFAMTTFAIARKTDAARAGKEWAPSEYPISFWCGPPDNFLTRERFQEIKDAGFTHVMPNCDLASSPENNRKILDLCRQVGLKAFLGDKRISSSLSAPDARAKIDAVVTDYQKHPALAGYFLGDEPGAGAFAGMAEVVAYLREKDPQHVVYANLFPNYAPPSILGTATYDEYLRRFVQEVQPFALSYDHYHFTTGGDGPLFHSNLASARKVSQDHSLPFWNIVLVTEHGHYRNPNEGELRFEAMQTLAYGGKGLLWFTYWEPVGYGFTWSHAIINVDGTRDPHYEMVKGINHEVRAIGKQLLNATSTSVFHDSKVIPIGGVRRTNEPIRAAGKGDFTIGMFENGASQMALITNADYKNSVTSDFLVSAGNSKVQRFNASTRRWNYVSGASATPDKDVLVSLQIAPGGAALLRW